MQRNDNVIPRLVGGAGDGVNTMCAMQVISWQTGDTKITDYPACSATPLARMVQIFNDSLAGVEGYLSPENSMLVLDLGWRTVGTAGASHRVVFQWMSDILVDPKWGAVRHAWPADAHQIESVAALCRRLAADDYVTVHEIRATYVAGGYNPDIHAAGAARAAANAANAAHAVAHAAYAANTAYAAEAAAHAAAAHAAHAARAAYAAQAAHFYKWAITRWRELMGLDIPAPIDEPEASTALVRV